MHTLNIDAARKFSMVDFGGPPTGGETSTPLSLNTPDILNSLISITSNPFFDNSSPAQAPISNTDPQAPSLQQSGGEEDKKVFATLEAASAIGPSPTAPNPPSVIVTTPTKPSSVQSLRSQFIKDSLKLTIQSKRKSSGKSDLDIKAELDAKARKKEEVEKINNSTIQNSVNSSKQNKLTPEDEERRKRRRERNKVAATKCRNKKKEKTGLLVLESETLEDDNVTLKSEISKLEEERKRLVDILASHSPNCTMKNQIAATAPTPSGANQSYPGREYTMLGPQTTYYNSPINQPPLPQRT